MPHIDIEHTEFGPYMSNRNLLRMLRETLNTSDVLMYQRDGRYFVKISYGSPDRDEPVRAAFDEAEFGAWESLVGAIRYALGAHWTSGD